MIIRQSVRPFFFILVFVWIPFCRTDDIGNANDYIDEVLTNLRKEPFVLSKLDPIDIPDVEEKNFQVKEGQIRGLGSLYRHGDCTLAYDGKIVNVSAEVAVRDVTIDVKYRAKALFFWINGFKEQSIRKNMVSKWVHIVLFVVLCHISRATEEDDIGNANDYVDTVLDNLRKEPEIVKYLDPLSVPDLHDSQYSLKNIRVRGLSNLQRHGDCTLSYDGETVNVVAEIGVANVRLYLDYSAKALFFWIHGDGEVAVDHLSVQLDLSSTGGNARLNSLKVLNLGNYYVKSIRGASFLLNWLVKLIANKAAQGARQSIIDALENEAKHALDNVLKQYKLPIY